MKMVVSGVWANITKINGNPSVDIAKLDGITLENISKVDGVTV
jgi:hypothetical protein